MSIQEVGSSSNENAVALKQGWNGLKESEPGIRIRNAAEALNVSELELLLIQPLELRIRLRAEIETILKKVETFGDVMALSRNDHAVHERKGVYKGLKVYGGAMGLYLGDIDLRLFLTHWQHVFAVSESMSNGIRRSLQFFDGSGTAIHKIYATDKTEVSKWDQLVEDMRDKDQTERVSLQESPQNRFANIGKVTEQEVKEPWSKLTDVHEFNDLLKSLQIDRLEAFEKVGEEYAQPLHLNSVERVLEAVAKTQLEIMVFVGNRGIVQIYTGSVSRLLRMNQWFNVLDPQFSLHLNTAKITSCWRVKRPSKDGMITSIECFNAKRELVISLFGARKPGQRELEGWQQLTGELEAL